MERNPFESKVNFERPRQPELFVNPPLPDTSLVYSVPFRGEWDNGNVLRMLNAMLVQRMESNNALEVDLIANISGLEHEIDDRYLQDELAEQRNEAEDKVRQTQEAIGFIKLIVEIQAIVRGDSAKNQKITDERVRKIIDSVDDPIQKDILQMAAKRAKEISIALVDATKMDFAKSPYLGSSISSARTMGLDFAMARFEHNEEIAVSMFDVDTISLETGTVREIQRMYEYDPKLSYIFLGMSDAVKGNSRNVASDSSMGRHINYNNAYIHGSPQISFRLRAYRKLKEISNMYLIGDEDRDAGIRLIYHFGRLQDGLLLETSRLVTGSTPRVLTADRIDGFVDGSGGKERFKKQVEFYNLDNDLNEIIAFRDMVDQRINELPEDEKAEAIKVLGNARQKEIKREKVQQRMNRVVVKAFFKAIEDGYIRIVQDNVEIDESALTQLQGGKALQFFLRMNPILIKEVLNNPKDLAMMRYYAGIDNHYPTTIEKPTVFHLAMRDYLGKVLTLDDAMEKSLIHKTEKDEDGQKPYTDNRNPESCVSLWHGMTAELLAYGHTYRTFFQTEHFFETRQNNPTWPAKPDDQELPFNFGSMEERVGELRKQIKSKQENKTKPAEVSWYGSLSFATIPGFEAFKRFFGIN